MLSWKEPDQMGRTRRLKATGRGVRFQASCVLTQSVDARGDGTRRVPDLQLSPSLFVFPVFTGWRRRRTTQTTDGTFSRLIRPYTPVWCAASGFELQSMFCCYGHSDNWEDGPCFSPDCEASFEISSQLARKGAGALVCSLRLHGGKERR